MRCLWRLWTWPKRKKVHDEEDCALLPGRVPLIQSWEMARRDNAPDQSADLNLEERYVRFGIGGAGNLRKSCFLFLGV